MASSSSSSSAASLFLPVSPSMLSPPPCNANDGIIDDEPIADSGGGGADDPELTYTDADVIIFVDYRETDLMAKMRTLFVPPKYAFAFESASLKVADIIVCRVAERVVPPPQPMAQDDDDNSDPDGSINDELEAAAKGDDVNALVDDEGEAYITVGGEEARPEGWPRRYYLPLFAVERKTRNDLASSAMGGPKSNVPELVRMSDQKRRMRGYAARTGVTLLFAIEGLFTDKSALRGGATEDGLDTTLLTTGIDPLFTVIHTADTRGTARLAGKLARYAVANCMVNGASRRDASLAARFVARKRDNYDPSTYYRAILQAVPNMTAVAASSLARVYPTPDSLLRAWRAHEGTERARKLMLSKIEISGPGAKRTRNKKLYKIAPTRSALLYTLLGNGIERALIQERQQHEDEQQALYADDTSSNEDGDDERTMSGDDDCGGKWLSTSPRSAARRRLQQIRANQAIAAAVAASDDYNDDTEEGDDDYDGNDERSSSSDDNNESDFEDGAGAAAVPEAKRPRRDIIYIEDSADDDDDDEAAAILDTPSPQLPEAINDAL